jgi:hypothetical protein
MAAWARGDAALAKGNWETFKLSELRLDQKNFRLGEQDSQRAAILEMIDDQKQKLVRLARDLMDVGPSPGEPVWVTKDTKNRGQYIVLEGNRRVTALKLMENPALADGTLVEKHFQNLGKLYQKKPIRELEALVFASREDAQPWIRRRHMTAASGVGLQRWELLAKARADKAHGLKTPRFLAVIEFLGDESEAWNTVYGALDDKWSTLDRVLNAKAMQEMLGVSFDLKRGTVKFENGNTSNGRSLLWRILQKVAGADFDFSQIERVEDREAFLGQFVDGAVKAKGTGQPSGKRPSPSPKQSRPTPPPNAATKSGARSVADHSTRPTLAPKSGARVFHVDAARLQSLYSECKNIKLANNRNAAALLLRVFIELSSEALLTKRSIPIPSRYSQTKWGDAGLRLDLKIGTVAHFFDPSKSDKRFQQARQALDVSNAAAAFSIRTLHGYFHNLDLIPDAASLRGAWDAWESYLRAVHEDLRKP